MSAVILSNYHGRGGWAYLSSYHLIRNSISVEVSENPSPSGDPWFNDPENIASLNRGIAEMKAGKGRAYSMDEIRELLGV